MHNLIVIVLLSALSVAGDWLIKSAIPFTGSSKVALISLGYSAYVLSWPAWYFALKSIGLSSVAVLYALTTVGLRILLDVTWFGHHLTSREIVGILFAVVAVICLVPHSRP
jgi:drug/metabolite transporter (DMT)-like permease